jgi:ABC-type transport system involved in multi-copper enzyme maturation permease subunit
VKTTEKDATRAAWTSAAGATGSPLARADATAPLTAAGAVQAPPLDPDAEPRGSLWRYAKYKLKDFLRERGSWMLALGGAGVAWFRAAYDPTWVARMRASSANNFWPNFTEADYFRHQLVGVFTGLSFIGVLIAAHGIVSRDRERGFQRFLFAKPVSAWRYYLQSFLVNGAGFVGITGLLLLAAAALFGRGVPLVGGMMVAAAGYAAIGGLIFLLSTLVRYDAALGFVLMIVGAMAQNASRVARETWAPLWAGIGILLPPVLTLNEAVDAVRDGQTLFALANCLPPTLYGVVCVVIGLLVIRDRSIAN